MLCHRCREPIMRDECDVAYCRNCGELFCSEECRDEHIAGMHALTMHPVAEESGTAAADTSVRAGAGCAGPSTDTGDGGWLWRGFA